MARCRDGQAAAWREAFLDHAPYLARLLGRLGVEPGARDDVVQDVFVVAHRRIGDFDCRSRLRTWLTGIALRLASQARRRQRVRRLAHALWPQAAPVATPESLVGESEQRRLLGELLGRLSARKREVFVLYEIEGLEGGEIAEIVGCPVNTVWSRLRHARADFRRLLARRGLAAEDGT